MGAPAKTFGPSGLVGGATYGPLFGQGPLAAAASKTAKPKPPPAPPDEMAPLFQEIARQARENELQRGKGRASAFGSPYTKAGG